LEPVRELNIGHFLVGEAVFEGLPATIALMREAMERGRSRAVRP
jgi:pyridoxine 5-phosphate synthase